MSEISKLLEIMAALRNPDGGCPWDLAQDFRSIAPYTIEEAYEVLDAIEREDMPGLRDELGDLLLQVVFHAQMAKEAGHFDFADVTDGISDKMLRRHPHVFESVADLDPDGVRSRWEDIKEAERSEGADSSALAGVARALPALKRAEKLGKRASRVGFDWPDRRGVNEKIREEADELERAVAGRDAAQIEEELGDLLFAVVNLARHLAVDPEAALSAANRKFESRFRELERAVGESGERVKDLGLESLDRYWDAAKKRVG